MTNNLGFFRSFMAVARHGQVARAAEELRIAQPSVSYQIAHLEREFGARLFVRTARGVRLTTAGAALVEELRPLFQRFDALAGRVRGAAEGRRGKLGVGVVSGAVLSGVGLRIVRAYRGAYPEVMLRVQALGQVRMIADLHAGELDVVILGSELDDPQLSSHPLAWEPYLVALPSNQRLARRRSVAYRELAGKPLIALARDAAPWLFSEILTACRRHGFIAEHVEEVVGEEAVMGLVAAGAGVAVIPNSWASIRVRGVVTRPLSPAGEGTMLRLFHRAGDTSPLVLNFVAMAQSLVERGEFRSRGRAAGSTAAGS
jgi:DNA-binding transcriptional LysR family regulator